jgi:hypothetical protein
VKRGETKFRAALRRWRRPRRRRLKLPQLTPGQWFRLALLGLTLLAAWLGIEGEMLRGLVELLVK